MNERIAKAYEARPKRWIFELAVAFVVIALLVWSGTAVETAGTTQSGAVIAWNILRASFTRTRICSSISRHRAYRTCCWRQYA